MGGAEAPVSEVGDLSVCVGRGWSGEERERAES